MSTALILSKPCFSTGVLCHTGLCTTNMLPGRGAKAITHTDPLIRLGASTVCKTLSTSLIRRERDREREEIGPDSLSLMFLMIVIV